MSKFKAEKAATILADAIYHGDTKTAEKWGVTPRTIHNWRRRLETDPAFSAIFRLKKDQMESAWAEELAPAIKSAIEYLRKASQEISADKPENIHAVAGALKILSEVAMTKKVLDARFGREDRSHNPAHQPLVPAGENGRN